MGARLCDDLIWIHPITQPGMQDLLKAVRAPDMTPMPTPSRFRILPQHIGSFKFDAQVPYSYCSLFAHNPSATRLSALWSSGGVYWLLYLKGVLAEIWAGAGGTALGTRYHLISPQSQLFPGFLAHDTS